MKKFWQRISDRDKLSYVMVIAFGGCLLGIRLFFQFGYMLGEKQIVDNPIVRNEPAVNQEKLLLLDEPSPVVRGIEITIALGLIMLGTERLLHRKKQNRRFQ